jgi:hypothetical protein
MRKKRIRKDEKREVTPEFVNMSKEILYPQIQGVTTRWVARWLFECALQATMRDGVFPIPYRLR